MPITIPVPTRNSGDLLTSSSWNSHVRDNINKLLDRGHRVLTVAQFLALTGLEDGDEAYVEVDATNGLQWHLRYHLSTTKWRFNGGPALQASIVTQETGSSVHPTYGDIATVGPSITIPLTGDYKMEHEVAVDGAPGGNISYHAIKVGAAAADDANTNALHQAAPRVTNHRTVVKSAVAADVVKVQYAVNAASPGASFVRRSLAITPRRIG